MLRVHDGVESKLFIFLAELGEEITVRSLATGICRALQGAHSFPWLHSPEDMSRARTPCTCAFQNRAVSRFASVILQSSRAQLIVLAVFWDLDSSRGASSRPSMPYSVSGSTCISVWSRWTGGVLILRRVCARTIQTSANAPRARRGSPHGPLQQEARRGNAQLRERDAITNSQMLLHLLVYYCRSHP